MQPDGKALPKNGDLSKSPGKCDETSRILFHDGVNDLFAHALLPHQWEHALEKDSAFSSPGKASGADPRFRLDLLV
jgi:hypothetical protein